MLKNKSKRALQKTLIARTSLLLYCTYNIPNESLIKLKMIDANPINNVKSNTELITCG